MPDHSELAQIPIPFGSEANVVPQDLARIVDAFEPLLNLKATDESDRDTRYATAPVGTVVSSTTADTIWRKGVGGTWLTVWRSGALTPFTPSFTPLVFSDNGSSYQYAGSRVDVTVKATYLGPDLVGNPDTGNITDTEMGTMPDYLRPPFEVPIMWQGNFSYGRGNFRSNGTIVLRDYTPALTFPSGGAVTIWLNLPIKQA